MTERLELGDGGASRGAGIYTRTFRYGDKNGGQDGDRLSIAYWSVQSACEFVEAQVFGSGVRELNAGGEWR